MPTTFINSARFYIATMSMVCLSLTACNTSSPDGGSSSIAPITTSYEAANVKMQQAIVTETPHFNNSAIVTGFNTRGYFVKKWSGLFNEAIAAEAGLSLLWDPENGNPPTRNDYSLTNLYIGSPNFMCSTIANTCTLGSVTVPWSESLKTYMGQALDPNFKNSNTASVTVFGRLQSATMITCALAYVLPASQIDTDSLPIVGSLTLTFPADLTNRVYQPISSGGCNVSTSEAGNSIPISVSKVNSPNFTKKITITNRGIVAWLQFDATTGTLNVMNIEDQRQNGRYAVDRAIAHITGLNEPGTAKTSFEYISLGSNVAGATNCYTNGSWECGFEYYRVYIDEAADVAYLVANNGNPGDASGGTGDPTGYVQYTAVGQPSSMKDCSKGSSSCTGSLALSYTAAGPFATFGNAYNGCVRLRDRSLAASNTLNCSATGMSVLSAFEMINSTRRVYAADVMATLLANTNENTTLAFSDGTDIFTKPNVN